MRSNELFTRPSRAVRPRKPIALVAALSTLLPGTGHVLLGHTALGLRLLAGALVAIPLSIVVRTILPDAVSTLAWLIGRAGILCLLFALVDAPSLAREPRWTQRNRYSIPPRLAAFLNALGYGAGHLRMDEKVAAWIAIALGGGLHVALLFLLPPGWIVLSELVPLALAAWAYRQAHEIARQRSAVVASDEDEDAPASAGPRPIAPLPVWLMPVQSAATVLVVATALAVWESHSLWLETRTIETGREVAMEPYYRNPDYGLRLEMRAPGWSFREETPGLFLDALHAAEKSRMQLRLAPRVPFRDGPEVAREVFRSALEQSGVVATAIATETVTLDGFEAQRLFARGLRGDRPCEVVGLCFGRGFRRYLLHMEWSPDRADFGAAEWDFVLNSLAIEDVAFGTVITGR